MSIVTMVAATVLSLTNEYVQVDFSDRGGLSLIRERASGRELVRPASFVGIATKSSQFVGAAKTEFQDGSLVFRLPGDGGTVTLKPQAFAGGWTFTVESAEVPSATMLYLCRCATFIEKYVGRTANMMSDESSALCVRPYDLHGRMCASPGCVDVRFANPAQAVGTGVGVVAGPRGRIAEMLKAMTLASGRAHSPGGGAWTLDTDAARNSYLNADVTEQSVDDWIDLMERGGFGVLHFRERWYSCRGHYPVRTEDWPSGLEGMKVAVKKVHDLGYLAGMHTLTACIDPKDPWVAGEENRMLRARESYRLVGDLPADATELEVDAPPVCVHDTVFTYLGNGNALRIGSEIVQYEGFTKTPPYRYTGLKRGAFGTRVAPHAAGDEVAYLEQRYIAFYPEADSELADKVADAIANVYNTCKFDQIYCDGAEAGSGTDGAYYTAVMRDKIIRRCAADGRPVLNEDSCSGYDSVWWMHSRVGAWDSTYWAPKVFHDYHVDRIKRRNPRKTDLLEMQMGWWGVLPWSEHFPAHKLDDIEYYASRNAGLDASMSIAGINVSRKELSYQHARAMTVLGWYERARRAKAFVPGLRERMDVKGAEFRLRQDERTGAWGIAPAWYGKGRLRLDAAPCRSILRVEALYNGAPVDGSALVMTAGTKAEEMEVRTAKPQISMAVTEGTDDAGARTLKFSAKNGTDKRRGAWACATTGFRPYLALGNRRVMRFRVKGDGSGALLNVQVHTPREYCEVFAEHYITIDFNGWRDFVVPFRERDAERFPDYEWPYRSYAEVFHRVLNMANVDAINFYLNEIPANGEVAVEITDVKSVRQVEDTAAEVRAKVNGEKVVLPFALVSGEYAELEDGVWTRYDKNSNPLERKATGDRIRLKAGLNEVLCGGRDAAGAYTRMQAELIAVGEPDPAIVDPKTLEPFYRKFLAYEAAMPDWYVPSRGFGGPKSVLVRPGEKATVEFRFSGKIRGGVLRFGGRDYPIDDLDDGKRCRFKARGTYQGVQPVKLTAREADCRVEIVKRY